jgi:subtilisin family serine protease
MNRPAIASTCLALLLAASARIAAQEIGMPESDRPVAMAGCLLVKVAPGAGSPLDRARALLAPLAGSLEIRSTTTWLNPALLSASPTSMAPKGLARSGEALEGLGRIIMVTYAGAMAPEPAAAKVAEIAGIEYAEPLYRRTLDYVPNDPQLVQQSYLEQVKAFEAWNDTRADSSIIIAIIDTGIDPDHPDLKDAIWTNPGETGRDAKGRDRRSNGVDDDGDGFIDDWRGYDFGGKDGYSPDNDPTPFYWHGTHVAGIAAAIGDNHTGIAGIAYGARLMPVKISDDAKESPVITAGADGILYAARMGAKIINCSWGGPGYSQAEQDLVNTVTGMGCLIVAAAGNNGRPTDSYPASYRGSLSVASVRNSDQRSSFSNFNPAVGIAAPGENIYSTVPTATAPSGYMFSRGTSMASPVVAGAAALVMKKYPTLDPEEVAAVLRANSDNIDDQNPDFIFQLGSGRLNIAAALAHGPDAVSASILDYTVIEENPDGVIEPGETIELRASVKNVLRPVDRLSLDLTSLAGNVQIATPEQVFTGMGRGEVRQSGAGVFRMVVPSDVPLDYSMVLQLTLGDGEHEIGRQMIELIVNPNYATTDYNHSVVTFTGNGRIGFNDFPSNHQGRGVHVDASTNLLAEGGLMLGVSAGRVADVVHTGSPSVQSNGLKTVEPYRVSFPGSASEVGRARFSDAHLVEIQQVGVDVEMTTYQFRDTASERMTLVLYKLHNRTGEPITNLFCALYLDWDIGPAGAYDKITSDLANRLGYVRNTRYPRLPMAGATLVSNQPMNFSALDNNGTPPLGGGFYQAEKWEMISGGIGREESGTGDCAMIMGAGPIALAPGADTVVAFSLIAGADLAGLQVSAAAARAHFAAMGGTPGAPVLLPQELSIGPSHPNPFDGSTTIEYRIAQEGPVSLDLYDMLGRHLGTLASGFQGKGSYHVPLTLPPNEAEGAYIVRLRAGDAVVAEKIVRIAGER